MLHTNVAMSKAGSSTTTVYVEIASFGVFSAEKNPGYANMIHDFLNEKLGVPSDRSVFLRYKCPAVLL